MTSSKKPSFLPQNSKIRKAIMPHIEDYRYLRLTHFYGICHGDKKVKMIHTRKPQNRVLRRKTQNRYLLKSAI
jgi:hypothetical protein